MSPNGEPGSAETAGQPAADSEQQIQASTEVADVTGRPTEGSQELVDTQSGDTQALADGEDAGDEVAAAAAAEADAADQRDLEQYPEGVREHFKTLPPARRRELYEHAEANARTQIEVANKRTAELQAANAAREAERQKILDSHGKFVGLAPIELTDTNGDKFEGPTYAELDTAQRSAKGRQQLFDKYGLNEAGAEWWIARLDENRAMLDGSQEWHKNAAWGVLADHVTQALEGSGFDPHEILDGAKAPQEWLPKLLSKVDERHEREKSVMKANYEARLDAGAANAEGMRGKVLAATSRQLPTGGRTGAGGAALTRDQFLALPADQKEAMRRDQPSVVAEIYRQSGSNR